jgi:hypothetical protein
MVCRPQPAAAPRATHPGFAAAPHRFYDAAFGTPGRTPMSRAFGTAARAAGAAIAMWMGLASAGTAPASAQWNGPLWVGVPQHVSAATGVAFFFADDASAMDRVARARADAAARCDRTAYQQAVAEGNKLRADIEAAAQRTDDQYEPLQYRRDAAAVASALEKAPALPPSCTGGSGPGASPSPPATRQAPQTARATAPAPVPSNPAAAPTPPASAAATPGKPQAGETSAAIDRAAPVPRTPADADAGPAATRATPTPIAAPLHRTTTATAGPPTERSAGTDGLTLPAAAETAPAGAVPGLGPPVAIAAAPGTGVSGPTSAPVATATIPAAPPASAVRQPLPSESYSVFGAVQLYALGGALAPLGRVGNLTGVSIASPADVVGVTGGTAATVGLAGARLRAELPLADRSGAPSAFFEAGVQFSFGTQSFIQTFSQIGGQAQAYGSSTVSENFQIPLLAGFSLPFTEITPAAPVHLDLYGGVTLDSWTQTLQGAEAGAPGGGPGFFGQSRRFTIDPTVGAGFRVPLRADALGVPLILRAGAEFQFRPAGVLPVQSGQFGGQTYWSTVDSGVDVAFVGGVGIPLGR